MLRQGDKDMIKAISISVGLLLGSLYQLSAQQVRNMKMTELNELIETSTTPMVINFWATWCVPCLQEIPYFISVAKEFKEEGVSLLLVSLDMQEDSAKVEPFAIKRKITAPIVWLNETNADYFCPIIDDRWSGSVPATLFVNTKMKYRKFLEKALSEETLRKEIQQLVNPIQ